MNQSPQVPTRSQGNLASTEFVSSMATVYISRGIHDQLKSESKSQGVTIQDLADTAVARLIHDLRSGKISLKKRELQVVENGDQPE